MGGCLGSGPMNKDPQTQRIELVSRVHDNHIRHDIQEEKHTYKMLLLGAGESGKSTFIKQLRLIHLNGFNDEEKIEYKNIIFANILYSIQQFISACRKNNVPFSIENEALATSIMQFSIQDLNPERGLIIKKVYLDEGIAKLLEQYSNSFHLLDAAQYFMDNIERILSINYIPSTEDILRSRTKTSGIIDIWLELPNDVKMNIVDVGGQRSERRKWIHCFDKVTAITYFVSLSDYDQVLIEDSKTNRMLESLKLFQEICKIPLFVNSPIILFLNKMDIFDQKIKKYNITTAFPEYTGKQNFEEAIEYIVKMFKMDKSNKIYSHVICATDTDCIQLVFQSVTTIILEIALQRSMTL